MEQVEKIFEELLQTVGRAKCTNRQKICLVKETLVDCGVAQRLGQLDKKVELCDVCRMCHGILDAYTNIKELFQSGVEGW